MAKKKQRFWGLAGFGVLWVFLQILIADILSDGEYRASVSAFWMALIYLAVQGNAHAIVRTAQWAIGLHFFGGIVFYFILLQDPYYNLRQQELFADLLIALAPSIIVWMIVISWASSHVPESSAPQFGSSDANLKRGSADEKNQEKSETSSSEVVNPQLRPESILLDYPRAKIAIEYRSDIKRDWEEDVRFLSEKYVEMYLRRLDEAPDQNAAELYDFIKDIREKDERPFSRMSANLVYADLARYGVDAQNEFREAHDVLGEAFDVNLAAERISAKYKKLPNDEALLAKVSKLKAGVYSTAEGHSFRIYGDGSVMLLEKHGRADRRRWLSRGSFCAELGNQLTFTDIAGPFLDRPGRRSR
jgi:hypothetical protein